MENMHTDVRMYRVKPVRAVSIYVWGPTASLTKALFRSGYVHLDIVNPETGLAVGEEGETPSVAKEKLEFMSKSQEFHAEPEPQATQHAKHRKVERVVFTKGKNNAPCPKDDAKKVENNAPPDIPAQDDICKNEQDFFSWTSETAGCHKSISMFLGRGKRLVS